MQCWSDQIHHEPFNAIRKTCTAYVGGITLPCVATCILLQVVDFMASYPFNSPAQAVSSISLLALGSMGTPYPAPALERMSQQQQIMAATLDRLEGDASDVPAGWWCSSRQVKRTEQRWQACLALLVYYLVDLGVIRPGEKEGKAQPICV